MIYKFKVTFANSFDGTTETNTKEYPTYPDFNYLDAWKSVVKWATTILKARDFTWYIAKIESIV